MKFALLISLYSGFTAYGLLDLFDSVGMQGTLSGVLMITCIILLALLASAWRCE